MQSRLIQSSPAAPIGEVIESEQIAAGLGCPAFGYRYKGTVGLFDFAEHPDQVMVPVLQWLWQQQPSLLQNPDTAREAIQLEAEIRCGAPGLYSEQHPSPSASLEEKACTFPNSVAIRYYRSCNALSARGVIGMHWPPTATCW